MHDLVESCTGQKEDAEYLLTDQKTENQAKNKEVGDLACWAWFDLIGYWPNRKQIIFVDCH